MEHLLVLLVLLVLSRTCGELAHRVGQPSLVGELLAGIGVGALIVHFSESSPWLAELPEDRVFTTLSELGIFFLMLYGGVELRASDLAKASQRSFLIALSGMLLPMASGFGLAWFFIPESDYKLVQCVFVGTALAITAVPASIRVLMDLGQLHSRVGKTIISAAVIDDLLSLIILGMLTGMLDGKGLPGFDAIFALLGRILVFFLITVLIEKLIVPRIGKWITHLRSAEFEFSSLVIAALAFGWLAEIFGLHYILGAFIAGLFFMRRIAGQKTYDEVKKRISAITLGLLAPIFFCSIGMHLDLSALYHIPHFLVLLVLTAFLSKFIGAGLPAYALGMKGRESLAVGVGMSARGAVELILADIALRANLFNHPSPTPPEVTYLFSATVIVAVVTTVVTPVLLRFVFNKAHASP